MHFLPWLAIFWLLRCYPFFPTSDIGVNSGASGAMLGGAKAKADKLGGRKVQVAVALSL